MHKYLKEKNISVKDLSNTTGIPYSTLNDIVNGKTEIGRVRFEYVKKLAAALDMSLDDFDEMFSKKDIIAGVPGIRILVRNKNYYYVCEEKEEPIYLCKVNELNTRYLDFIVKSRYEDLLAETDFTDWKLHVKG